MTRSGRLDTNYFRRVGLAGTRAISQTPLKHRKIIDELNKQLRKEM